MITDTNSLLALVRSGVLIALSAVSITQPPELVLRGGQDVAVSQDDDLILLTPDEPRALTTGGSTLVRESGEFVASVETIVSRNVQVDVFGRSTGRDAVTVARFITVGLEKNLEFMALLKEHDVRGRTVSTPVVRYEQLSDGTFEQIVTFDVTFMYNEVVPVGRVGIIEHVCGNAALHFI